MQAKPETSCEKALSGYWEWHVSDNLFYLSTGLLQQLGYQEHDLPQTAEVWQKIVFPQDLPRLKNTFLEQAKKQFNHYDHDHGSYALNIRLLHKKGQKRCFTQTGYVVEWDEHGNPQKLLGSHIRMPDNAYQPHEMDRLHLAHLFKQANQVASIGMWEYDCVNDHLFWDPITKDIHQVEQMDNYTIDQAIDFYLEGSHRKKIKKAFGLAIKQGKPYDLELQILTRKGNLRWIRTVGVPELQDGKCQRISGIFQDVDPQKTAEEKVKESLHRNRILIEQCPNALAMLDTDAHYIAASHKWREVFSLNGLQATHFSWEGFINKQDLHEQEILKGCLKGESHYLEEEGWNDPGEPTYWFSLSLKPWYVRKDEIGGILIYAEDITQRKESLIQLGQSEEQFRKTFEDAAIGMAIVSLSGQWLKVNSQVCEILGYSEEAMQQKTFQQLTHPLDLKQDEQKHQALLQGKLSRYQTEKRYIHREGHIIWVYLAVSLIKDKGGQPSHFITQIKDITARKDASRQLEENYQIIQNQNERLLNFAHIVSHNLRSHSSNLGSMLEIYLSELEAEQDHTTLRMITEIAASLSETVENLTQIVRVQTHTDQQKESIQLKTFIKKALDTLQTDIKHAQAQVLIDVADDMFVIFNPAYLDSILLNLISNAIKYRHRKRKLIVNIKLQQVPGYGVLIIQDNGLGIDLVKYSQKLFGLYQTFHEHPQAQGVGLFITKNQIEAMGGKIEVESQVDSGTTFKVYFLPS